MTWVYAGSLLVGFVALLIWLVLSGISERAVAGKGLIWQRVIGAVTAFGIAGMSATFGGWPALLAAGGAAMAAAGAALYVGAVGVE
ncbi:MAG TPA: hypothetical protein ENH15_06225 [Actinobacteria bacterium]|nr:hypothetical protein [Actinomycetota bacterium]